MVSDGAELRATLRRLQGLLARSGEAYWAKTVSNALENRDDAVLAHVVQSWFADMGALNRLVLSPTSGPTVPACAVDATNRAFIGLRNAAFRLSRAIASARPGP